MNIQKKLIIKDGMSATYQNKIPIVLCNVEWQNDRHTYYFRAKNKKNNALLLRGDGRPLQWDAQIALETDTIKIDNPQYVDLNSQEGIIVTLDPLREKRESLRRFFLDSVKFDGVPFIMDDEQLSAILSDTNTLVTARAGSGKTRVLVGKLLYLFEKQNLSPNNVLAFCFNRDASEEINKRLKTKCEIDGVLKYASYDVASTFHAYARRILERPKILTDEKPRLIKDVINELKATKPNFSKAVYDFFRKDTLRIDRKSFYKIEDYYKYLRNSQYTTLNNETVKSRLEKIIADFLFEHGIDYRYEASYYPSRISLEHAQLSSGQINELSGFLQEKKEIIPDFYLPKHHVIWEHWAVIGNETKDEISHFEKTVGNYTEYIDTRTWKKKFWSGNWRQGLSNINKYNRSVKSVVAFLETNGKQFDGLSREEIENKLEQTLLANGIKCARLTSQELYEKAWKRCLDGFTQMMEQFVNRFQQNFIDDMDDFIEKAKPIQDEKTKMFYRLGYQVYCKYVSVLSSSTNADEFADYNHFDYDFNQIVFEASKCIASGQLDNELKAVKWILIDEYQDFSKLFDLLIGSILSRNSSIKVFCVGDDWQAINRYAGSDLKYYKAFSSRYADASLLNIRTNYRSGNNIVKFANKFMDRCDMTGERPVGRSDTRGKVTEIDVTKNNYLGNLEDENNIYLKYLDENEYRQVEKGQYLKKCSEIIKACPNAKIMILNRSNLIVGKELTDFNEALKKVCAEFLSNYEYDNRVVVKTVHTAKGEERDVVILLGVNEGAFPVFNPNNDLFEIFGQKMLDAIEDEQRLYYVAITRAKQYLYILYEGNNKSPYIMNK